MGTISLYVRNVRSGISPMTSLISYLRERMALISHGRHFKARCPFCGGSEFMVFSLRETWRCYSCQQGGGLEKFKEMMREKERAISA